MPERAWLEGSNFEWLATFCPAMSPLPLGLLRPCRKAVLGDAPHTITRATRYLHEEILLPYQISFY